MTTETMKQRLRRVAAKANQKKAAGRRTSRKKLIARLEKEAAEAADHKSRSFDEQSGGASTSAADKYDRKKKNKPSTRGDDPKTDYDWEAGEGYPNEGSSSADLGSGQPDAGSKKKSKQQALDEADEERRKNTSDMDPMDASNPSRPRPKLSSAQRREWRRKRIAQLKKSLSKVAFNPEGDPEMKKMFSDMEAEDAAAQSPRTKGVAPKQVRVQADQIQKTLGKALAQFLPKLQEANSDLEMAVTGGKLDEIKGALNKVLTTSQFVMKNVLIPQGGQMQKLMMGLRQASVQDDRLRQTYLRLSRMNEELSRSRTLVRMAASHIRI